MNMELPVYLFTGFLEAGKTKFIAETMKDPNFNDGKKRFLIIQCEDGEEELDPEDFGDNVSFASFEEPSELTPDRLSAKAKRANADIVVVEYNGMWTIDTFYNALPENWLVYQEILIVDATTVNQYNANMRQLMVDKLTSCEMVAFNRVKPEYDKMVMHKLVRGISKRANICYEDMEGEIEFDDIEDPLPYDLNADTVEIGDDDFAYFYRDISEDLMKYSGKTIRFRGIVVSEDSFPKGTVAVGRQLMVCCADDISYRAFATETKIADQLETGMWVIVTAKIVIEKNALYQGKGPVLKNASISYSSRPERPVATF